MRCVNTRNQKWRIDFIQDLDDVLRAGIDLTSALRSLQKINRSSFQAVNQCLMLLEEGQSFSLVLQQIGFSALLCYFVQMGEQTGEIDLAVHRMHRYLTQRAQRKEKIITTLLYPTLLAVMCVVVIELIAFLVLPAFLGMYQSLYVAKDSAIQVLFQAGKVIAWLIPIAIFLLGSGIFVLFLVSKRKGTTVLHGITFHSSLRNISKIIDARDRFEKLSFLLQGGIDVLTAVKFLANIVPHEEKTKWLEAISWMEQGEELAQAFCRVDRFPDMAIDVLELAQKTGDLQGACERLSAYYGRTLERKSQRFFRMLEPTLTIVLGLIVGGATVMIMIPMMDFVGKIA